MKVITIILLTLISTIAHCKDSVINSGDWEANSTWIKGIEPTAEDTLFIGDAFTVEILSNINYATPVIIIVKGTLSFKGKLSLPSGSEIILVNGKIESTGGGNSDKINIGASKVWSGNDGDYTGDYVFSEGGIALPVNFGELDISSSLDEITLSWVTYQEVNNERFMIEVSTDLNEWLDVDQVEGSGTSNNINYYESIFTTNVEGYLYVRIKQIDYNGDFDYSKIVSIELKKQTKILHYITLTGKKYNNQPLGLSIGFYDDGTSYKEYK